jgi:hypothetical protein
MGLTLRWANLWILTQNIVENSPESAKFSHKFNIFMVKRLKGSGFRVRGAKKLDNKN